MRPNKTSLIRWSVYSIVPGLAIINWIIFRRVVGLDYFDWYLTAGPFISGAAALTGQIFDEIDDPGLTSANPGIYYGACLGIVGFTITLLGEQLEHGGEDVSKMTREYPWKSLQQAGDFFAFVAVILGVVGVLLVWLFVIAPVNYFATLLSGAPSRFLSDSTNVGQLITDNPSMRRYVGYTGLEITDSSGESNPEIAFVGKPFAATQSLTSVLLVASGTVI